jgi:hypothetical protein
MNCVLLTLVLLQASQPAAPPVTAQQDEGQQAMVKLLVSEVLTSGRVLSLVSQLDDGIRVAPGVPPLLAFRYLEGRQRGRFGGLDLVLDDAGH